MEVIIVNHSKRFLKPKEMQDIINKICNYFLTKRIRNKLLLKQKKELSLVFLGKSEMKKINKKFRKKNKPTDILSFTGIEPSSLGELLLCLDVLKKQATAQEHSLKSEITYMLIHGILHLLGYDHEISQKEEKLMLSLQDGCFATINKGL